MKRAYWKTRIARSKNAPAIRAGRYEKRYQTLQGEGFLWWEAYWLAQHRIDSVAMRRMRQDRREVKHLSRSGKESYADYQAGIRKNYTDKRLLFNSGSLNPFKLLDTYKKPDDVPETPQPKRKKTEKKYQQNKRVSDRRKVNKRGFITGRDKHLI